MTERARPGGTPMSMPTAGPSCRRASAIAAALRGVVRERGFRRGRGRDPAGLARQRGASARLRDASCIGAGRRAGAALPAHLAGIRLQEAAGGRRDADLRLRPRLPQPRARRRCTIPNSPCSNGTGPASPTSALMRGLRRLWRWRPRPRARAASPFAAAMADPFAEPERLTVAEAFDAPRRHRPPGDARSRRHDRSRRARGEPQRGRHPRRRRTTPGPTSSAACWSSRSSRISASAGRPSSTNTRSREAALARPKPDDPRVAERFELYACGVELANAFGELTDPAEQRRRFEAEMAEKAARLRRALSDRRGLPGGAGARCRQASGIALGFDRLVMLATGAAPHRAGDLDAGVAGERR